MQHQELSDTELISQFRVKDTREKAFTQIVNKYKEKLYWHIRRLVVSHEDADDILQNVFIKVWKGLDNFREESQLFTWLYRIATNESISHIQKLKKLRAVSFDNEDKILSEKIKADDFFDASKLEWKLQLAIQTLPEQQRLVFNLRYYDEMPYSEMSEILHVTTGSLKASYHHAARKIEDYLLNH